MRHRARNAIDEHRTPGEPDSQRRSRFLTVTRSLPSKRELGYRREGEKNNSLPLRLALCASRLSRFTLVSPASCGVARLPLACQTIKKKKKRKKKFDVILSSNQNCNFLLILPPTESFCLVCFNLYLKTSLSQRGRKSQLTVVANTLKVT